MYELAFTASPWLGYLRWAPNVNNPFDELIQAFMIVLVTCKNEEDPMKYEGPRVVTTMLHYPSIFKMLKCS